MIYVASSWRNVHHPTVVKALRAEKHTVYDFRNPEASFAWPDIDPNWKSWTTAQFADALSHPLARAGFEADMTALRKSRAVVVVLPCGRSAHLEAGWAAGQGKLVIVYSPEKQEPELMYSMFNLWLPGWNIVSRLPELLYRMEIKK